MTKVDIFPDIEQCHCNNSFPAGSISTLSGIVEVPSKSSTCTHKKGVFIPQLPPKADPKAAHYLELQDQSAKRIRYKHRNGGKLPSCTKGFLVGDCDLGHRFLKVLLCGKEWCPECGEKWSWLHQRRYYRMLPKLKVLADIKKVIGYLVITVPKEHRQWMLEKGNLNKFRRYVIEFLKRQGYDKGIRAWHWAGEDGEQWNPHLNLLLPEGYIKPETLNGWRELFTAWLETKSGIRLKTAKSIVINYSYSDNSMKQRHWLRYIVRPTMRVYNPVIAAVIKGNKNIGTWGKWEKKTEQNEIAMLERNLCPECGTKVRWHCANVEDFEKYIDDFEELKAGYFMRKFAIQSYEKYKYSEPPPRVLPRYKTLKFSFN